MRILLYLDNYWYVALVLIALISISAISLYTAIYKVRHFSKLEKTLIADLEKALGKTKTTKTSQKGGK